MLIVLMCSSSIGLGPLVVNSTVRSSIFFGIPRCVGVGAQLRGLGARALEAEHDVVGGERRAVVELDAGTQLEAPRRRVDLRPRFGERGLESELLVANDQEFVDELVDVVGQVLVLRVRVGRLHVAAARPAQRLGVRTEARQRKRCRERECERDGAWNTDHDFLLRGRCRRGRFHGRRPADGRDHNAGQPPRGRIRAALGMRARPRQFSAPHPACPSDDPIPTRVPPAPRSSRWRWPPTPFRSRAASSARATPTRPRRNGSASRRRLARSIEKRQARAARRPAIAYPPDLPVAQRADDIARAIRDHQVVIVCGETGSGKTTQLPKICMAVGRGERGLIGHTQPRRIAARAVATRIAQELGDRDRRRGRLQGALHRPHEARRVRQADDRRHPARRDAGRPAARRVRHDHHRRGARAQPQHRFPAGLPEAAAAAGGPTSR